MQSLDKLRRREFLRRASLLGIAGTAAPWAMNLAAIGEAAAAAAPSDYKALVCVFLYGGNDYANMVVPFDADGYQAYAAARPSLAIAQDKLLALTPRGAASGLDAGRQMALAPQLTRLQSLFNAGQLGVQLNVGPLVQPTTLAQYQARSVPLPANLFSHADQQAAWQSSGAANSADGWGGRIGEQFLASNGNASFTCINVSGNATFMAGEQVLQYQVAPGGALAINGLSKVFGSTDCAAALRSLITAGDRTNWMEQELVKVASRQIAVQAQLNGALSALPALATAFDARNALAQQLQMVARIIAARGSLGMSRQVFLVSMGGFDLHSNLATGHPTLMAALNDALGSFYDATVELGVASQVTSFTASEFGRTLASNGDGADHGWGAHHLVMGGAVQGGRCWGQLPSGIVGGPDDTRYGSPIPSSSVTQLAATLGAWMGAPTASLGQLLPRLSNFTSHNLGYFG